jgi:DNA modification methylase
MTKNEISTQLKDIPFSKVLTEWFKLKDIKLEELENLNGRNRLGCDFIDYYFFQNRLETIGNKGINFYDFLDNIEYYKTKTYIQTLLTFCEKNNRYNSPTKTNHANLINRYYYCYGLCFGRINAFKITNALKLYHTYKPHTILDPFCGFGGRLTAALLLDINYIGIDLNVDLKPNYERLMDDFGSKSNSKTTFFFQDAQMIDYNILKNKFKYDMVMTSPPYENIEIYKHSIKKTQDEWSAFYNEVFTKLWDNLAIGGTYAININDKIYQRILIPLFGQAKEIVLLKKSSKNGYTENIYIWTKKWTKK